MRLLLLAPLLLVGCSVFQRDVREGGPFGHDGYALTCNEVPADECLNLADDMAQRHRAIHPDQQIVSVSVTVDDERTICWASTAGNRCLSNIP